MMQSESSSDDSVIIDMPIEQSSSESFHNSLDFFHGGHPGDNHSSSDSYHSTDVGPAGDNRLDPPVNIQLDPPIVNQDPAGGEDEIHPFEEGRRGGGGGGRRGGGGGDGRRGGGDGRRGGGGGDVRRGGGGGDVRRGGGGGDVRRGGGDGDVRRGGDRRGRGGGRRGRGGGRRGRGGGDVPRDGGGDVPRDGGGGDGPRDGGDGGDEGEVQSKWQCRVWIPRLSKLRYLFTVLACIILISTTTLLLKFINHPKNLAKPPCFQINDKLKNCEAAVITLRVSAIILGFGGVFFLNLSYHIRNLAWFAEHRLSVSVVIFISSIIMSNLPTFISPQSIYGFWISSLYHLYFWMSETSLAIENNTNLHSTFASINFSVACALIISSSKYSWAIWARPISVLVFAGILHIASHFYVKYFKPPNPQPQPPPETQTPPPPTFDGTRWYCIIWFVRNCLWVFTITLYLLGKKICGCPVEPPIVVEQRDALVGWAGWFQKHLDGDIGPV